MTERSLLFEGKVFHDTLLADLAYVMDHSYDIDEIYTFYVDWCKYGEDAVDTFAKAHYSIYKGSSKEEQEDAQDNFIALRNAMINLYCSIDRATFGLERHTVKHALYYPDEEALIVVHQ